MPPVNSCRVATCVIAILRCLAPHFILIICWRALAPQRLLFRYFAAAGKLASASSTRRHGQFLVTSHILWRERWLCVIEDGRVTAHRHGVDAYILMKKRWFWYSELASADAHAPVYAAAAVVERVSRDAAMILLRVTAAMSVKLALAYFASHWLDDIKLHNTASRWHWSLWKCEFDLYIPVATYAMPIL